MTGFRPQLRAPFLVILFSATLAGPARAAEDAFTLYNEEARVITASRRLELVREAPAAVEIITAEEIRDSEAANLWDLFRFRAGMNVADGRSGDGNRAIVSIRGFPAEFVDKLLVLVDGRSVYTALSGGAVWDQIPVQLHSIERIEIVRGPNAALYGSNAGLGVINIITKKPGPDRAGYLNVMHGTGGLRRGQASYSDGNAEGAFRLGLSQKALDGYPTPSGPAGTDYLLSNKGDFRGLWTPTDSSSIELFGGGSWDSEGVIDAANPVGRFHTDFQMIKYNYDPRLESSIQVMAARREDVKKFPRYHLGPLSVREDQYDGEIVHRFSFSDDRLRTVYGGSIRYSSVDSGGVFDGKPYQKNAVQRAFASQSWLILPRVNLIGAASLEHSDTGGNEPAYQVAAVVHPAGSHTLRLSHGLAPTIPTLYQRYANQRADATVLLVGNPRLTAQHLRSYEAGYRASFLDKHALFEADFFYLEVDNLSRTIVQSYNFPLLTLSFDNDNKAAARGVEIKTSYRWDAGRSLYANYTYETLSVAKPETNVRRGTPAHKVNLGGTADVWSGFSAGVDSGYQDGHTLYSQARGQNLDIPAYWRIDVRLAYAPPGHKDVKLYLVGQNLITPRHLEFAEGLAVPRSIYGGVSVKFGPFR
ncbi:MAG: TonB-dependent receptor plug domain-containing protein [Elusimicrobia bacterium]|nr:TonB-dependent receptor plug domain-containing protein [Elusimicrobiota bacterium]